MTQDDIAGVLLKIWIKRARRGPMDAVDHATAIVGHGLDGCADRGGRRQVTLIREESWDAACRELGVDVPPEARRANLLVRGIDLEHSRGQTIEIGDTAIRIFGETRPCERMDAACSGLRARLSPEWRAGAFGEVVRAGVLRVGDRARWIEPIVRDESDSS